MGFGPPLRLPADQAGVAAVHGVAEHAFDGVLAQELEKMRLLNRAEPGVLIGRREAAEIAQDLETFAVGFAGTCFVLVAVLRIGLDPRSLGVAVLVAAVR